jgi:DNA-binding response OmpR family regulator
MVTPMNGSRTILAFVPELLTSVRIESAAQRAGCRLRAVDNERQFLRELRNQPVLAILDLGHHWLDVFRVVEGCHDARVPVLAFGPHADMMRQKDARTAGAEFVYPRSKFMADTTGCLRDALNGERVS